MLNNTPDIEQDFLNAVKASADQQRQPTDRQRFEKILDCLENCGVSVVRQELYAHFSRVHLYIKNENKSEVREFILSDREVFIKGSTVRDFNELKRQMQSLSFRLRDDNLIMFERDQMNKDLHSAGREMMALARRSESSPLSEASVELGTWVGQHAPELTDKLASMMGRVAQSCKSVQRVEIKKL